MRGNLPRVHGIYTPWVQMVAADGGSYTEGAWHLHAVRPEASADFVIIMVGNHTQSRYNEIYQKLIEHT